MDEAVSRHCRTGFSWLTQREELEMKALYLANLGGFVQDGIGNGLGVQGAPLSSGKMLEIKGVVTTI
jgi:hypothetical protein